MAEDKAWFSYQNLLQNSGTEITTNSEQSSLPATNVADRLNYRFWRTQALTANLNIALDVPGGEPTVWQAIVLQFVSNRDPASTAFDVLNSSDQITINASNSGLGSTDVMTATFTSNFVAQRGYVAYVHPTPVDSQFVQIRIQSTSQLGYFDLGYVHMGPIFQPRTNYNVGSVIDFEEDSLVGLSSTSGASFVESRQRLLAFEGSWGLIDLTERTNWLEMQELTGITRPVAFGTRTAGVLSRDAFIARFERSIRLSADQNNFFNARVSLLENR